MAGIQEGLSEALSVGHEPVRRLSAQDETLFRAFQSNLLSLISHELRTPLTGILNALTILDESASQPKDDEEAQALPRAELVRMARQNAQRLHSALVTILDLAQIDTGTFHVRLREVDLARIVSSRIETFKPVLGDKALTLTAENFSESLALADSQKFARAVDLCFQTVAFRAMHGSEIVIGVSSAPEPGVTFRFRLQHDGVEPWERAWRHGLVSFESGVGSPASAFAGVLQSEEAFLTRTEEGLGSELLLVHEVMRLHQGSFHESRDGDWVTLSLKLPDFSSDEAIKVILSSRAYENTIRATSVGLVLIEIPLAWRAPEKTAEFCADVKRLLFRTTDSAYALPKRNQIAVVTDEISSDGTRALLDRIRSKLKPKVGVLRAGVVQCPADAHDPTLLLELAEKRLS